MAVLFRHSREHRAFVAHLVLCATAKIKIRFLAEKFVKVDGLGPTGNVCRDGQSPLETTTPHPQQRKRVQRRYFHPGQRERSCHRSCSAPSAVIYEAPSPRFQPTAYPPPYYDVSADGKVTALDAFRVINHLARNVVADAEELSDNETVVLPPQAYEGSADEQLLARQSATDVAISDAESESGWLPDFGYLNLPLNHRELSRIDSSADSAIHDEPEGTLLMLADDVAQQWDFAR